MLPFSVLRTWFLGLFSWALIGAGIWLGIEFWHALQRPETVVIDQRTQDDGRDDRTALHAERTVREPDNWKQWLLLAGAIGCIGFSFFGRLPVSLLTRNSTPSPRRPRVNTTLSLERSQNVVLSVRVFGQPQGPTLLLTHGWSLDSSAWDYVLEKLAARYRVVVWDLAGLGDSSAGSRKEFSIEQMAEDLEAVRSAVKAEGHLIMVGHSIGGMILQTWCRLYPAQLSTMVQGLVLLHTTYTNPLKTNVAAGITTLLQYPVIVPLNWLTIAVAPLVWLSNWQSYRNGSLQLMTRLTSFSGRQSREHIERAARLTVAAWPATVARGNQAMTRFNGESILQEIEIPVLVVSGKHDRLTVCAASERISQLLPNDRPFSLESGHLGLFECSEPLTDILIEFTERLVRDPDSRLRQASDEQRSTAPARRD